MLCGLWVLFAGTNYRELKLVSILIRDAEITETRNDYPHPGGRGLGGNWTTVRMGRKAFFSEI